MKTPAGLQPLIDDGECRNQHGTLSRCDDVEPNGGRNQTEREASDTRDERADECGNEEYGKFEGDKIAHDMYPDR